MALADLWRADSQKKETGMRAIRPGSRQSSFRPDISMHSPPPMGGSGPFRTYRGTVDAAAVARLPTIGELASSGELAGHIGITLWRVAVGFLAGAAFGTVIGAVTGYSQRLSRLLDPTLQALRAIPSIAWVPLFILWFGIFEASKVALIAVGVFFPSISAFTAPFVVSIVRWWKSVEYFVCLISNLCGVFFCLPSCRTMCWHFGPVSGLAGCSWAAEFMGASNGLGYLLVDGQQLGKPDQILAAILIFAVFGKLTDTLLIVGSAPFVRWHDHTAGRDKMLIIDALSKTFPNGTQAISGFSLEIKPGEVLAIIGGSGCGKSTLLRLVSGLESATRGRIILQDKTLTEPDERVNLVFQEPRLFPWLSVADNIGFGLKHLSREDRHLRVLQALDRMGLSAYGDRWVRELSGGQHSASRWLALWWLSRRFCCWTNRFRRLMR